MFGDPTSRHHKAAVTEGLENRTLFAITTAVECVKVPGPTDTQVTVATNPAGNTVPGQSSTETVSNRECRKAH